MALWHALAPAATVAQLVGADAAGLVSATLQAVRTARRNRKECHSLAKRVMMVGDLLQLVRASEAAGRPEVQRALDGLGSALRRAYELVESSQERGAVYGFVMAGRQLEQFRDVQGEIDSYLLAFPMVSHIDITIRLDRIYNMLLPSDHSQQESEAVSGSPTSNSEPHSRNEGSALGNIQVDSIQTVTEAFEVEEHQREGFQDSLEELLSRDQKLKWLCWWPQQVAEEGSLYNLLKAAANNFSSRNEIGSGGWSTVYKAHIGEGLKVALKRYPTDTKDAPSHYDTEFHVLKMLQHVNIIKLLGHCTGQGEMILVYEFNRKREVTQLDVTLSYYGGAQGLLYLHTHELSIVHRDLKPSNILLDSNMNAKISDFGIAKMLCPEMFHDTCISGTIGYMAPEYLRRGILSTKVDVYAYGVILLEVIAGKKSNVPCLQDDEYKTFIEHVWHLWMTGRSSELIDPSMHSAAQIIDISRCIQIALLCLQVDPQDRPAMSDVVLMLHDKKIVPDPKEPDVVLMLRKKNIVPDPKEPDANETHSPSRNATCKRPTYFSSNDATWSSSDFTWPR
ncbi:LOW QUALITY PROTEIN: hypothetical protein U9M48_018782 [Paspalum notatum var. saurae]|uniref:Protein kinase domain-containing protein n=1 Tax=Paspalum notatum var. saurae TaxID=547442 RepID=A0AAQ3TC90_PASNO